MSSTPLALPDRSQEGGVARREASPAIAAPLELATYRVTFTAVDRLTLPGYLGSTLRGAIGNGFRALACPSKNGRCLVPGGCAYHLVFDAAPPEDATALRTHEAIPRPFVISAPAPLGRTEGDRQTLSPGSELVFGLTLIGKAHAFLPHFVAAFRRVKGVGRGLGRVSLKSVVALDPLRGSEASVYPGAGGTFEPNAFPISLTACASAKPIHRARVTFVTQTRLTSDGATSHSVAFQLLFRRLLGRLSSLATFAGDGPLDEDFKALIERAASVTTARSECRWTTWERWSNRQHQAMEWSGTLGEVDYEGDLSPFWPYLVFGQWTHVGKGATFGLGRYELKAIDDPQGEVI